MPLDEICGIVGDTGVECLVGISVNGVSNEQVNYCNNAQKGDLFSNIYNWLVHP